VKLQAIDRIQTQVHLDRGALESCSRELQMALSDIRALKLSYNSLVEEVQVITQFASDARTEIVAMKQELMAQRSSGPSQPGERMDDKALEMLSSNLAVVSSKANEVENIKLAIELMKRRLTRLEEGPAHPNSAPPHASPQNTTPDSHSAPGYGPAASLPPEPRSAQEQDGAGGWASVNQAGKRAHVNGVDVGGDSSPSKRPRLAPLEPRHNYDGAAPPPPASTTRYDPTRHDVEEQQPPQPQPYRRADSGELSHDAAAYKSYAEQEKLTAALNEERRRSVSGPTTYSPAASQSPGGGRGGRGRGGRPRKYLAPDRSSWISSREHNGAAGAGRQMVHEGHVMQQGPDGQWYPVEGSRRSSLAGPPQTLPSSSSQQPQQQQRQPSLPSIAAAAVAAANVSAVGPMGAGHIPQQQHHHHAPPPPTHHDPRDPRVLSHHHHHAAASGAPPPQNLSAAQRDAYAAAAAHANSLKKTRAKPFRNADGVLIRKDGRPDMRSHSSAANLRKVHARKEEERRSGGGSESGHQGAPAAYVLRADDSASAASTPRAMRHADEDDEDDERHRHHERDDERYDDEGDEESGRRRSSSAAAEKMMRQLYPHGVDVERRAGGSVSGAASARGTPRRYESHRGASAEATAAALAAAGGRRASSSNGGGGGTPRSSLSALSPVSPNDEGRTPLRAARRQRRGGDEKEEEEERRPESRGSVGAGAKQQRVEERDPAGRMDIAEMKELAREIKQQQEQQQQQQREDEEHGERMLEDAATRLMQRERMLADEAREEDLRAPKLERGPEAVGVHGE
jgi:hypothetical protein